MRALALSMLVAVGVGGGIAQSLNVHASVWYLGHCGFAVKTAKHLLVFDYQEQRDGQPPKMRPAKPALENGWINPEEIKHLSVRVFASHSHNDHYDPVVLNWKVTVPDIEYFFGWKVSDDTSLHCLIGPRAEFRSDKLEIATTNSHHSGVPEVAWLVKVDGLVIYHNGDCQPADPGAEYGYLKKKADRIDIAFVPPVHDEQWKYTAQNMELFRRFSPQLVFPMHVTAGGAMYTEFAQAWKSKVPELSVAIPMKMGERFEYDNNEKGKLKRAK